MKIRSIGVGVATAALLAILASCMPAAQPGTTSSLPTTQSSGAHDFVNPETGARRCHQLIDQLEADGFSVSLTRNADQYDIELALKQPSKLGSNLVRLGETEVAVTVTFPDGTELAAVADGKSTAAGEFTFDLLGMQLDLDSVLKLLAADSAVHFAYQGYQGYGDYTIPASAWNKLRTGFGETCLA